MCSSISSARHGRIISTTIDSRDVARCTSNWWWIKPGHFGQSSDHHHHQPRPKSRKPQESRTERRHFLFFLTRPRWPTAITPRVPSGFLSADDTAPDQPYFFFTRHRFFISSSFVRHIYLQRSRQRCRFVMSIAKRGRESGRKEKEKERERDKKRKEKEKKIASIRK